MTNFLEYFIENMKFIFKNLKTLKECFAIFKFVKNDIILSSLFSGKKPIKKNSEGKLN